jgi:hypothetical protein
MAIVERNVSSTTTRTTRPGDTVVVDNTDSGAGILVVLGIIVAFAAAYFLYDYYSNPTDSAMTPASGTTSSMAPASGSTVTPAEEPASQPATTQPAGQ